MLNVTAIVLNLNMIIIDKQIPDVTEFNDPDRSSQVSSENDGVATQQPNSIYVIPMPNDWICTYGALSCKTAFKM